MNGIYIHIPFCKSRCPYCDFHSSLCNSELRPAYVSALIDEIKTLRRSREFVNESLGEVDTLYIGGGTPSVLSEAELSEILLTARESFNITDDAEITVECNPGSPIEELMPCFKSHGVNRISLGMQSAVDEERKLLGRSSDKNRIRHIIKLLKENGINNISLDIMLGIPEQTKKSLTETLKFINECDIQHVSAYILKLEEGTFFHTNQNRFSFPTEDECCELYELCCEYLEQYGFRQYEISNFAKPGFESRHNAKYWTLENYLGIGAAAHSFVDGKRFYFPRDTQGFIDGNSAVFDCFGNDKEEYIMLRLRMCDGLKLSELDKLYGEDARKSIIKKAPVFKSQGLVDFDGENLSLTRKGFLLSNSIISEFI